MDEGPGVAQYGVSHTLARPKTPTRSENRTLASARHAFPVLLSHTPCPTPAPPHAPPDRSPPESRLLRRLARAPLPQPHPEFDHHVASPPPALLRRFWPPAWPPRRLPLAAWPTAAHPPLTAALAVAAWLERRVERKKLYKKGYFLIVNC
jgi:hypothetical protein